MCQLSSLQKIGLALLLGTFVGCGGYPDSPVISGSVVLDGKPLTTAQIQFEPKDDAKIPTQTTTTDEHGNFVIKPDSRTFRPVQPGVYIVTVNKFAPKDGGKNSMADMVNLVPAIYTVRTTSPLMATVKEGENKLTPFELKSSTR